MDHVTTLVLGGFPAVDNSQNSPPVGETRLATGGVESATVRIAGRRDYGGAVSLDDDPVRGARVCSRDRRRRVGRPRRTRDVRPRSTPRHVRLPLVREGGQRTHTEDGRSAQRHCLALRLDSDGDTTAYRHRLAHARDAVREDSGDGRPWVDHPGPAGGERGRGEARRWIQRQEDGLLVVDTAKLQERIVGGRTLRPPAGALRTVSIQAGEERAGGEDLRGLIRETGYGADDWPPDSLVSEPLVVQLGAAQRAAAAALTPRDEDLAGRQQRHRVVGAGRGQRARAREGAGGRVVQLGAAQSVAAEEGAACDEDLAGRQQGRRVVCCEPWRANPWP